MEQLPIEIMEKILIYDNLNLEDVNNLLLCSKHFYYMINENNTIWKTKFIQKYPHIYRKLEEKPNSYHREILRINLLNQKVTDLLKQAAENLCRKVELSPEDLQVWEELLKEKWDNYYYIVDNLVKRINFEFTFNSMNVIPLNTYGNLTQKYYAVNALRFLRQLYVKREWQKYILKPPEHILLEEGVTLFAQWFQPLLDIEIEDIRNIFDTFASMVIEDLKVNYPLHPILKASAEQMQLWKEEIRPRNEWKLVDCFIILQTTKKIIFQKMEFSLLEYTRYPFTFRNPRQAYLNLVLETRTGTSEMLSLIFECVVRRLGVRCEPILLADRLLMRIYDHEHPTARMYYIVGGKYIKGHCNINHSVVSAQKIILKLAQGLEIVARETDYSREYTVDLRSVYEFYRVITPNDNEVLINLVKLYMKSNFSLECINNVVMNSELDDNIRERLANLKSGYTPIQEEMSEVVRRIPNNNVKYAIGMVMYHKRYDYKCVIFNWDPCCMADESWKLTNNVNSLTLKEHQPFYNVLVEHFAQCYVAEENLIAIPEPNDLQLDHEVGRYFTHFYQTHYVPNTQTEAQFPDDAAVRKRYHVILSEEQSFENVTSSSSISERIV